MLAMKKAWGIRGLNGYYPLFSLARTTVRISDRLPLLGNQVLPGKIVLR
jgi:hypothetical protein